MCRLERSSEHALHLLDAAATIILPYPAQTIGRLKEYLLFFLFAAFSWNHCYEPINSLRIKGMPI